jgi:hypothetical protein
VVGPYVDAYVDGRTPNPCVGATGHPSSAACSSAGARIRRRRHRPSHASVARPAAGGSNPRVRPRQGPVVRAFHARAARAGLRCSPSVSSRRRSERVGPRAHGEGGAWTSASSCGGREEFVTASRGDSGAVVDGDGAVIGRRRRHGLHDQAAALASVWRPVSAATSSISPLPPPSRSTAVTTCC